MGKRKDTAHVSSWYGYDDETSFPDHSNEQLWESYTESLTESTSTSSAHCVSCWYEEHSTAFPDQDSSSLCERHAQATRMTYHKWGSEGRYA